MTVSPMKICLILSAFAEIATIKLKRKDNPPGHGIADVVFIPKRDTSLPAMIVELKWNKGVEGALAQIKEKNYPKILENYGGDIVLVGLNYNESTKIHKCTIERKLK